ncbi:MAG: hypothetical protein J6U48_05245, partial [Alistipes sp.]|nr:hypothetical protein [Alistipes sp.]
INDHTTTESVNEMELVKDLYDRMEREISTRDAEIAQLRAELESSESDKIPYKQLAQEITSTYPTIQEVHITRGESVHIESIEQTKSSMIVVAYTNDKMSDTECNKLESWLKIRLSEENITLFTIAQNEQPTQEDLQN